MLKKRARERAEIHVRKILEILGLDVSEHPDMEQTPARIIRMYEEFSASVRASYEEQHGKFTTFAKPNYDQLICVAPIVMSSMCSHHGLPFFGRVWLGYIPNGKAAGYSKFMRLVRYCAARPQMQEDLTETIAEELVERLNPRALIVVVKATHTCARCRGVRDPEAEMTTSALRGDEKIKFSNFRTEFFQLLQLKGHA